MLQKVKNGCCLFVSFRHTSLTLIHCAINKIKIKINKINTTKLKIAQPIASLDPEPSSNPCQPVFKKHQTVTISSKYAY